MLFFGQFGGLRGEGEDDGYDGAGLLFALAPAFFVLFPGAFAHPGVDFVQDGFGRGVFVFFDFDDAVFDLALFPAEDLRDDSVVMSVSEISSMKRTCALTVATNSSPRLRQRKDRSSW